MTQPNCDDSALLTEFFGALNARAIPYCVMGDSAHLPQVPQNDVDIVCGEESGPAVAAIIATFSARHGGWVAQVLRHESSAFYHVLYIRRAGGRSVYLKLDICRDYIIDGRLYLAADWLLAERKRVGDAPFFTAAPAREFAYYLLKKMAKGVADGAALRHLSGLLSSDREGCRAVLRRYWSEESAKLIEQAIAAGRWSDLATAMPTLRRELDLHLPRRSLSLGLAEIGRGIDRVLRPTGFVVAVLGPDGSGKGTLLANLVPRLSPLGRRVLRFHLAPPISSRPASDAVVKDPHGRPPRGALMSALKLGYFVLVYNLGWLRSVWLARKQSGMIFFDRYYHDVLADPLRYRSSAPQWLARLAGRLIPVPDLFLVLDVDPSTARSRKVEVSVEESERQFHAYRALSRNLRNAHLIDANMAPMDVTAQCEEVVVRAMAARLQGRARHAAV